MSDTNAADRTQTPAVSAVVSLAERRLERELDIALDRSANAKGIEHAVLWWRAAGL